MNRSIRCVKRARNRMQQRCVNPLIVDLLLDYGAEQHVKRGRVRRCFDKRSRRTLRRAIGRQAYNRLDDLLYAFLIEQDGYVITVGWRH